MNTHLRTPTPLDAPTPNEPGSSPSAAPPEASAENTTVPVSGSPSAAEQTLPVGGKYKILEEGSAGGMGIVYKAYDVELDRIVALKLIKGGVLATNEEIARFRREAQAAARLNHPNVIPVYEIGQEGGCPYFTMAFARGGSLTDCRNRFADPRAAAELLEKVARAIQYAHQHGILHRDLKPGNILFDEHGAPLVSDFGLAKLVDATLELTRPGQVMGTPAYMAPEQASGQLEQISPPTDVWALGVLLYELLTGQRPFIGETQEEKLRQVRTAEPPRPRSINRSLDPALETVILKCLEKEPSRRYASAEALADDLARWLRGEPVLARPPSRLLRVRRALHRYRTLAVRLVFAALLLVLLVLAWRNPSPSDSPTEEAESKLEEGNRKTIKEKLAQLRTGKKVTLLGKTGLPSWWRWQLGLGPERGARLDQDRVFSVYAGKQPAMLELLSSTPKHYRLRAEIQHIDSPSEHGKVGIYFAHARHPTEEGTTHCFFRLEFNDRVPTFQPHNKNIPPRGQVRLVLPIYKERKEGRRNSQLNMSAGSGRLFDHAGNADPMPWRKLEVEVTPQWIRTFWEGELVKTRLGGIETDGVDPREALEKTLKLISVAPRAGIAPAELALGEGIGLYVEQGVAAFRSVVIEPLPPR